MDNIIRIDFTREGKIRRYQRQLRSRPYGATELAAIVFDGDLPMPLRRAAHRELDAKLPAGYWMKDVNLQET